MATPVRHFRAADDLWTAARAAAGRRDLTVTDVLTKALVELVEADRLEQAWRDGLEPAEQAVR